MDKELTRPTPEELDLAMERVDEARLMLEEARAILVKARAGVTEVDQGRSPGPREDEPAAASRRAGRRRNLPTKARKDQILSLLRERPGLRRSDVAESLGLTRARAGQLVNLMIEDGLLVDTDGRLEPRVSGEERGS
jgi:hypothetical protein